MDKQSLGWKGIFPVMVVPFDEDGNIDEKAYMEYVAGIMAEGPGAIITLGHNSECWALSPEEKRRVVEMTVDVVSNRVPVIVGADDIGTGMLIKSCQMAADWGGNGVMVPLPYLLAADCNPKRFFEEVLLRYQTLSDETPLPIMLYNSPRRTGVRLSPEQIDELADVDKVVAMKNSIQVMAEFAAVLRKCSDRLLVLANAHFALPLLMMGAEGILCSGPLELLGRQAVEFMEKAQRREINDDLIKVYDKFQQIMRLNWAIGTYPAAFKALLQLGGRPAGLPRKPILPVTDEERAVLKSRLQDIGIVTHD